MADEHGHSDDVFHHVRDAEYFELPSFISLPESLRYHGQSNWLKCPYLDYVPSPGRIVERIGMWWNDDLTFGRIFSEDVLGLQTTKFMILQAIAFVFVAVISVGLSRHIKRGEPARGRWWNFWEAIALFIRDEVVRPAVGTGHDEHAVHHGHHNHGEHVAGFEDPIDYEVEAHGHVQEEVDHTHRPGPTEEQIHAVGHPADRYLPFIWSIFFYILFCNLLGAIPWLGSATGHISVTGMLAVTAFAYVVINGSREVGFVGYWKSLVPGMDVPGPLKFVIIPMIWVIELAGLLIKHGVLAVRLFANMLAGHTVLAVILGFIAQAALLEAVWVWYLVAPASVIGQVAIGLLEIFVAFLQAYIFALLTSLFLGAAIHPH